MNRFFLIIALLFIFSCKSSKTNNKDGQLTIIEQTASGPSVISIDEIIKIGSVPKFRGDSTGVKFMNYMYSKVRYPVEALENNIQGHIWIEFVIDINGSVTDAKVIRNVHKLLDAEALRVVKSSPKWTPGYVQDEPVKTKYTFPFTFRNLGVIK